ncbi:MAG: hypothetical protein KDB27_11115 [Planctomycetales bacterium]|nr:hypothetical protein [Planctomycetales bacterium]
MNRVVRKSHFEGLESRSLLTTNLGNILFLGDSITHGATDFDSYRFEFWKSLIDPAESGTTESFDFQFVGSQNSFFGSSRTLSHNSQDFPNIHEGHFGWNSESVLSGNPLEPSAQKLSDWLQTYDVDLAFIHLGTNDLKARFAHGTSFASITRDRLASIVGQIQADSPDATILVAQIIPYYKGPPNYMWPPGSDGTANTEEKLAAYNADIIELNGLIASDASSWSTSTSRVYTVDHHFDPNNPSEWLPIDHYVDQDFVHLNNNIGSDTMANRWFAAQQAIPPTVTGVRVTSSDWTASFINSVDPELGLGYPIPKGANQSAPLPWVNLTEVLVTFDQQVNISESDVTLTGTEGKTYTFPPGTVNFDAASNTASILLPANLTHDALTLTIGDTVTDLGGNALDGEWTDGSTLPRSGNGSAGGDFIYSFNVLPGDTNQDFFVSSPDLSNVRSHRFTGIGDAGYSVLLDVTGDGFIASGDISGVRSHRFSGLTLPAAAKVDQVFANDSAHLIFDFDLLFEKKRAAKRNLVFGLQRDDTVFLA